MEMLAHPVTLLFLTVTVYGLANLVRARTGSILCNPVMISTCLIILYLGTRFSKNLHMWFHSQYIARPSSSGLYPAFFIDSTNQ